MEDDVKKVNGTWEGMPINIKKIWGGHEFTADECAKLFNNEIIEFEATSKNGVKYKAKGKLERQTFEGHEFIGFKPIFEEKQKNDIEKFEGTWNNKFVKAKRVWGGHRFTDEEIDCLLAGGIIKFKAVSNKSGKEYIAKGKLAEQSYNNNKFIGFKPEFD